MYRFLAGAAACFLLLTGAFLIWQSRAQQGPGLPAAPEPRSAGPLLARGTLEAPEASPKSREERRFWRADKNRDGVDSAKELHRAPARDFVGPGAESIEHQHLIERRRRGSD